MKRRARHLVLGMAAISFGVVVVAGLALEAVRKW